jgi:hypothetical protein
MPELASQQFGRPLDKSKKNGKECEKRWGDIITPTHPAIAIFSSKRNTRIFRLHFVGKHILVFPFDEETKSYGSPKKLETRE